MFIEVRKQCMNKEFQQREKNIRNYQTEIKELQSTILKKKNSTEEFKSRLNQAEERWTKRAVEFTESEEQTNKKRDE